MELSPDRGKVLHLRVVSVAEMVGSRAIVLGTFQCLGVLLIWTIEGQGPTVLAVDAGGYYLDFYLSSIISLFVLTLSHSFLEIVQYRLKY